MPIVNNYRAVYYHIDGFIDYVGAPGIYTSAGIPLNIYLSIAQAEVFSATYPLTITIVGNAAYKTRDQQIITEAIIGVDLGANTFTIANDYSASLVIGKSINIVESTGNNGVYTVVSSSFGAGNTVVVVSQVIPTATVDGFLDTTILQIQEIVIPAIDINYLLAPTISAVVT